MILEKTYESVVRRLVEAAQVENLAVVTGERDGLKFASVYEPTVFVASLKEDESEERIFNSAWDAIRGYITIEKPDGTCSGAWSVSEVWGPGLGSIVYGMGFVMSPSGILMPDRFAVSRRASAAWEKASQFLTKIPLDDCHKHNIPTRPWIDFAYAAGPRESEYRRRHDEMAKRHVECMSTIDEDVDVVEEELRRAGRMSFGQDR